MSAPVWRIYYWDGSTFDSNDGRPYDAPGYGVQCIVQPHPDVGRTVTHRFDWYYWSPETSEWWGSTDLFSVLDLVLHRTGVIDPRTLCQARHSNDYQQILAAALVDPDFPVKSASLPSETPTRSF